MQQVCGSKTLFRRRNQKRYELNERSFINDYAKRIAAIGVLAVCGAAHGQNIDLTVDLSTTTNTPEAAVGVALSDICTRLTGQPDLDDNQQQLLNTCTSLTDPDLDFEERLAGLEAVSAKASTASNVLTTRIPFGQHGNDAVKQRISALRQGMTGFSLSRLSFNIAGEELPATLFSDALSDRQRGGGAGDVLGLEDSGQLSGFISGNLTFAEQTETSTIAGFDADAISLVAGADYRFNDRSFAGVAIGFVNNDVDLADNGGAVDGDGLSLTFYGSYSPAQNWFIDATAYLGSGNYDLVRRINYTVNNTATDETAKSSTDSDQTGLSVSASYEYLLKNGMSMEFLGLLNYSSSDIDGYTESNAGGLNLRVEGQTIDSLALSLSAQLQKSFSLARSVITPQATISLINELENDGQDVAASFVSDPAGARFAYRTPDRDGNYITIAVGAAMTYEGGAASFVQLETLQLLDDYDQFTITAGYRREF